jgi:hypothetical protein
MPDSPYAHGQFCWVDLVAHDSDEAVHFYRQLFDWSPRPLDTDENWAYTLMFHDADIVAGIGQMSQQALSEGAPPLWNSYVQVRDVDAASDRAVALGARLIAAPRQVLDAGRLAFIEDPGGAPLGLWEPGAHAGATRQRRPGSLCWTELSTRHPDEVQTFYHDLFGWSYSDPTDSSSPYTLIRQDDHYVAAMLEMNGEWGDIPSRWNVYFAANDVDAVVKQAESAGGSSHHGAFDTAVGRMAVVADPGGALFHLLAPRSAA